MYKNITKFISLFLILLTIWFVLMPSLNHVSLWGGLLGSMLTTILVYRVRRYSHTEKSCGLSLLHTSTTIYFPIYCLWLIKQLISSSFSVIKDTWSLYPKIKPHFIVASPHNKTDFGLMMFAHSITLTPGTITVCENDNHNLLIHSLHNNYNDSINSRELANRITKATSKKNNSTTSDAVITLQHNYHTAINKTDGINNKTDELMPSKHGNPTKKRRTNKYQKTTRFRRQTATTTNEAINTSSISSTPCTSS